MPTVRKRTNFIPEEKNPDVVPKLKSKRSKRTVFDKISLLIRVFGTTCFVTASTFLMWVVLPLRFTNPIWRKFGVPNSKLPTDLSQRIWAKSLLKVLGVTVHIQGAENVKDEAQVLMCSHASNLDPLVVMASSPVTVKFIFKQSLLVLFYIFGLAYFYGHIPINRSKRDKAIESLTKAGKKIAKYNRAIGIFPEGTRSNTGQLQEFKKGPFHLVVDAEVPVTPAVIFNNYSLWPPGQPFPYSGEVWIRFMPQLPHSSEDTVDTIQEKVRQAMETELKRPPKNMPPPGEKPFLAICCIAVIAAFLYYFFV